EVPRYVLDGRRCCAQGFEEVSLAQQGLSGILVAPLLVVLIPREPVHGLLAQFVPSHSLSRLLARSITHAADPADLLHHRAAGRKGFADGDAAEAAVIDALEQLPLMKPKLDMLGSGLAECIGDTLEL